MLVNVETVRVVMRVRVVRSEVDEVLRSHSPRDCGWAPR
jgi:hypothetical protein